MASNLRVGQGSFQSGDRGFFNFSILESPPLNSLSGIFNWEISLQIKFTGEVFIMRKKNSSTFDTISITICVKVCFLKTKCNIL